MRLGAITTFLVNLKIGKWFSSSITPETVMKENDVTIDQNTNATPSPSIPATPPDKSPEGRLPVFTTRSGRQSIRPIDAVLNIVAAQLLQEEQETKKAG